MSKRTGGADSSEEEAFSARGEQLIENLLKANEGQDAWEPLKLNQTPAGWAVLGLTPEESRLMIRFVLQRMAVVDERIEAEHQNIEKSGDFNRVREWVGTALWHDQRERNVMIPTLEALLARKLSLTADDLGRVIAWFRNGPLARFSNQLPIAATIKAAEHHATDHELSPQLREGLTWLKQWMRERQYPRKLQERIESLLGIAPAVRLEEGEAWSDAVLADLSRMAQEECEAWTTLLACCQKAGSGKFGERWRRQVEPLINTVGREPFKEHVLCWFPLVDKPRTQPRDGGQRSAARHHYLDNLIIPPHVEMLRGLVWCCGFREDADLARAVAKLAISAYRKIPGKGPRLVSLGNACVTALGMMPGLAPIGQLAILKTKVKFGSAQKEIEKAFNVSATREGLARDEIEELAVPSYGLESVGLRRETFDDYQAELIVDGTTAWLQWLKDGKPLKSVPAAVKKDRAEEFKELQGAIKDINSMLPAQRARLDTLYLTQKTWPLPIWKERYLDHPLIGTIARRLIWTFAAKGKTTAGMWHDGQFAGVNGQALEVKDNVAVALWHPIGQAMEDVLAWRDYLERREIVQPFKQAHREVYLLTDAERRTRTYSNRFAAHILRQHQFNALCAARGWKNKLRLMVDDSYPPASRPLPAWNLRAEFWIEGAGSEYGQDTNETGTYHYLATDQVRFYALEAAQLTAHAGGGGYIERWDNEPDEPLPLESIPPLVFSEILRDVDLFVGVSSVGNDPNWADGGPGGQYRDYWQSYSFGELSATAQTRKALLERLLPRLKIADRCSFADRFLIVRGSLRTYKIHLGSGNILMEPNDQYLCIVPKQSVTGGERVFLPFEGDGTLSIVLSKAFLLADDAKITDPTIISQLKR